MGCDIHTAVEVFSDGKWKVKALNVYDNRCYSLFAQLANVRNYSDLPFLEPKGFPQDSYWEVNLEDGYFHSPSHLTVKELKEFYKQNKTIEISGMLSKKQQKELEKGVLPDTYCQDTNMCGYETCFWEIENEEMREFIRTIEYSGRSFSEENVRVVFYFDN